jgi:hypothetical protein
MEIKPLTFARSDRHKRAERTHTKTGLHDVGIVDPILVIRLT